MNDTTESAPGIAGMVDESTRLLHEAPSAEELWGQLVGSEPADELSEADVFHAAVSLVGRILGMPTRTAQTGEVVEMIGAVHGALLTAAGFTTPTEVEAKPVAEKPTPAVPIKKSITPDHLLSLIDGKPYKSLKRHLGGHGYTPETYRAAFDLPATYPMVAETYAKQRSELAKASGLGRKAA